LVGRLRDAVPGEKRKSHEARDDSDSDTYTPFKKCKCLPTMAFQRVPADLRGWISEDVWSTYSLIRRESFCLMHTNPNAFFYRNRPPGDPRRFGCFGQDEERLFLERLWYFREDLHIEDGLWGLFAVPLRGRVGYQCSNFCRSLIFEKKFSDPKYAIDGNGKLVFHGQTRAVPADSKGILEHEAMEFVAQCLRGDVTVVSAPVRLAERVGERSPGGDSG
jgi:hypothetical protein